ncbi:MAG: LysM peptidoglycan-binding domain-containing protein [Anaerolineae bacterium]
MKYSKWLALAVIAIAMLALAGCGRGNGVQSASAAPAQQATAQPAASGATLILVPDKPTLNKGDEAKVEVKVNNVKDLYGADVRLQFDPSRLEVVDANPGVPGTQIEVGKFLDPSSGKGFVAQNSADNGAGRISYAVTLLSPAQPAQGSGALAIITFKAKEGGPVNVGFQSTILTTPQNETIPVTSTGLGQAPGPVAVVPAGSAAAGATPKAQAAAPQATGAAAQPQATGAAAQPQAQGTPAAPQGGAKAAAAAVVLVDPASANISVGGNGNFAVKINNVTGMYGADITLTFDPAVVEVQDADAGSPGTQITLGDCFPAGSQVVRNEANNAQGTARVAASRVAPAQPVNGACTVFTFTLKGKANGQSKLTLNPVQVASREGAIETTQTNGNVVVGSGGGGATATPSPEPTGGPGPEPSPTTAPPPGGGGTGPTCTYVVRPGDTVSSIALRFGTTVNAIVSANGLADPDHIKVGQTLVIPNCSGNPAPPPEPGPPPPGPQCMPYVVQPGDTVLGLAQRFGTSVEAIVEANHLTNPHLIRAGQTLIICPGGHPVPPQPPSPCCGRPYVVRPGDTLSAIALRFNTTVYALARANNLANPNAIYVGQVLNVP